MKSYLDTNVIWSQIKVLRFNYLSTTNIGLTCDKKPFSSHIFIPEEDIINNYEKVLIVVGNKSSDQTKLTLSKNDINIGARMFLALNSCPSFHAKLFWNTFYGTKSRIAMLASNIVKKAEGDELIKAKRIFAKVSSMFGFEHNSYHNEANKSFSNTEVLTEHVVDITGEVDIKMMSNKVFEILIFYIDVIDKMLFQAVSNHPIHILNNKGELSPSSFCSFGRKFIGIKRKEFKIPVCNIFKPKNYFDQICYETDLQELKDGNSNQLRRQLELGLTLVLDYNEERQAANHIDVDAFSLFLDTISIELERL